MPGLFYSSIFGELTKQVQIRIDAAFQLRKRLFDQNIYERYLDWDTPTVGLNFEEIIGQYNLSVAAATLDSKGKEPIMGTEGFKTLKEKVLAHQMSYSMPIEDYRKVLQVLDSRMLTDDQKTQQLINLMWNNVTKVVNSVQSKLDIIFLGALSNKGVFTFDANNNPEGGVRGVIDYKMPSENIAKTTVDWVQGNESTVDCFEDLQEILDAAQDKVTFDKILISQKRLSAGKLGVIKNAYADNELRQERGVTYSNYGRIRVSQWGKGETDNSNGVEFTKAQSLSLPVITEINGIYSLTVES